MFAAFEDWLWSQRPLLWGIQDKAKAVHISLMKCTYRKNKVASVSRVFFILKKLFYQFYWVTMSRVTIGQFDPWSMSFFEIWSNKFETEIWNSIWSLLIKQKKMGKDLTQNLMTWLSSTLQEEPKNSWKKLLLAAFSRRQSHGCRIVLKVGNPDPTIHIDDVLV